MALKVVYENKAVGVTGNVTNTATEKQSFVDLTQLDNANITISNYGTLEKNNWLLKNDVLILPDTLTNVGLGYWSTQLSDDDGDFTSSIKITRTYNGNFTSPAIALTFDTYNDVYATAVNIKWYRGDTLLYDKDYTPTSAVYSCEQNVTAYNKVEITITAINKPQTYLKIFKIDDGIIRTFYKDEIVGLTINESVSDTGDSLEINTMNLHLLTNNSIKIIFQRVQALKVYKDDDLYGTFFVESSTRDGNDYTLTTYDLVGMLDNQTFYGGIYSSYSVATLVEDICGDLDYELDSSYSSTTVTGYLPISTARNALMQVAFVLGAIVDTSRSDKIKIYPLPTYSSSTAIEIDDERAGNNLTEVTEAPVTEIDLTVHKYVQSGTEDEIYNDTLDGTVTATFSDAHYGYTITGGTISTSGANYVTFTGTGSTVVVSGYTYKDETTIKKSYNPENTSNSLPNLHEVTNATLVNSSNASSVMGRLEDVLFTNATLDVSFILDEEQVGDYISIETPEGEKVGQILNIDYDLDNGSVYANATIREVTSE